MQAARGLRQVAGQGLHVRAEQLGELAVLEEELGQRVLGLGGERLQDLGVRRAARLRLLDDGEAEVVEEDVGELLGRVRVELLAGRDRELRAQARDAVAEHARVLPQHARVERNALALHGRQHAHERHLDRLEELAHVVHEQPCEVLVEPPCHVAVLGRVRPDVGDAHVQHVQLVLPLADEVRDGDGRQTKQVARQHVHVVRAALGVDERGGDHRVEERPGEVDAGARQHVDVVLEVLPNLERPRVLQDGLQDGRDGRGV